MYQLYHNHDAYRHMDLNLDDGEVYDGMDNAVVGLVDVIVLVDDHALNMGTVGIGVGWVLR